MKKQFIRFPNSLATGVEGPFMGIWDSSMQPDSCEVPIFIELYLVVSLG